MAQVLQPPPPPCPPSSDHPKRTPEEEADKHTEMMKRDLQLTDAQMESIFQIYLNFAKNKQNVKSREEMIVLFKQLNESFKVVLTEEQYQLHIKHQQEVRNRRHNKHANEGNPMRIIQSAQEEKQGQVK